ncbi:MAG: type II toxin-antitoxin system RelE/ParE family toxin, partial [Devosia sp.]
MLQILMIRSVRHKGLKRFIEDDDRSKLPADMVDRIRNILTALADAATIDEMDLPAYRLHALKGDLRGFYAVTVRATGGSSFVSKTATPSMSISSTIIEGCSHAHEDPLPPRRHRQGLGRVS